MPKFTIGTDKVPNKSLTARDIAHLIGEFVSIVDPSTYTLCSEDLRFVTTEGLIGLYGNLVVSRSNTEIASTEYYLLPRGFSFTVTI